MATDAMFAVAMDGTVKIVVAVFGVEAMAEHLGILDVECYLNSAK